MNFLRYFFLHDWTRKVLALVFALVLYWNFYEGAQKPDTISRVPVTFELAPGLAWKQMPQDYFVTLTVRGRESEIAKAKEEKPACKIRVLARDSAETTRVKVKPEDFTSMYGIRVEKVSPSVLELPLQTEISRSVPVEALFSGKLPEEYVRGNVNCWPPEVLVTGPEDAVRSLNAMNTREIPQDGATGNFSYEVQLRLNQPMKVSPEKVNVQVEVVRSNFPRTFHKPVLIAGCAPEFRVEIPGKREADVELAGAESRMSKLLPQDIRVFADLSGIRKPGVYSVPVICVKPDDVALKSISPGEIQVKLTKTLSK